MLSYGFTSTLLSISVFSLVLLSHKTQQNTLGCFSGSRQFDMISYQKKLVRKMHFENLFAYLIYSTPFNLSSFEHLLGKNTRIRSLFSSLFLPGFSTRVRWVMEMFELTRMITRITHDFGQIDNGHFMTAIFCGIGWQIWNRCHFRTFL